MTRFLFWNVRRKPLGWLVAALAKAHDLDLILLAEAVGPAESILTSLRHTTGERYHFFGERVANPRRLTTCLQVYSRLGPGVLEPVAFPKPTWRYLAYRLHQGSRIALDALLVLAHAPSRFLGTGADDQKKFFRRLRRGILWAEHEAEHRHTILVGDLNVDPFDARVASADGIQGVPTREVARLGHRVYDGRKHHLFYNPMWCLYGDRRGPRSLADDAAAQDDPVVAGTYFFRKDLEHRLYWHMYDQVMIRPGLIDRFPLGQLRIIGRAGRQSLFGPGGEPSPSDHLPILFHVDLRTEPGYAV